MCTFEVSLLEKKNYLRSCFPFASICGHGKKTVFCVIRNNLKLVYELTWDIYLRPL